MTRAPQMSFLDTNILIYTFDNASPAKQEVARNLVADALKNKTAVISFQVVQEFLTAAMGKFSRPMTASESQLYLSQVLMRLCEVFPDPDLYARAAHISAEAALSYDDSLIVASALAAGCTVLLSESLQHGLQISGLEIRNPFLGAVN